MGKRLRILVVIFSLLIGYALYYIALPKLMNLEDFTPVLTRYIKQEYGYNIKFENTVFKMGYLPSVWLKADSIKIINPDKTEALSIDKPVIKVTILPLIIGKVHIKYFSANNIFADFNCDDRLHLSLGDYLLIRTSNFIINISQSRIFINKFKFNLNDKVKNDKIIIIGKYFNLEKFSKNKYLKTSFDFDIKTGNKVAPVVADIDTKLPFMSHLDDYAPEISISVANLDISKFANYIKYFMAGQIFDASGMLNMEIHSNGTNADGKQYLSTILLEKPALKTTYFEKDYSYAHKILMNADFFLKGTNLKVSDFGFKTPKFEINLLGEINKIDSKNPVPDLNLKIVNQKAQDLLEFIPYCAKFDKMANIYVSVIKDAKFFADVNVDLNIKNSFRRPKIFGDIKVTNAYILRPIKNAPKNADIFIKYIGEKLNLDVLVPTDKNQNVAVKGLIDVYGDNYVDLHITSTPHIDLSETERVLMPVHKAFNFLIGPVPIMAFSGFGSIDLNVKGTKKDPHTFGWFKTANASTFFDDIPKLVLTNADAYLEFDDTNTKFTLNKGAINGKDVSINGTCNLKGKFDFDALINNQNSSDLLAILKTSKMLSEFSYLANLISYADGLADLKLNISGQLLDISELDFGENVHAKGNITLHSLSARMSGIDAILRNISGSIKFNDFALLPDIVSNINNSKILLSGNINNNLANLKFNTEKLNLYDAFCLLSQDFVLVNKNNFNNLSYASFSGKYSGPVDKIDFSKIKTDGNILFKNFEFIYKPLKMPINVLSGQVSIKNGSVKLNRLNSQIGTMPAVIGGNITNVFQTPYLDISLFARPNQKFFDYIFNAKSLYPIKLKGNVSSSSLIWGSLDKLNIKLNTHIDKNSRLYYMGATIGSEDVPINLFLNSMLEKDRLLIKNFNYDKILDNKSRIRQLNSNGIIIFGNNLTFNNFKVITNVPTDMKIFNILFKKPLIKGGNFTSDIVINGSINKPSIRGNLNLFNVNIPFWDAIIKNVSLRFLQNTIIANIIGSTFENSFVLDMEAVNSMQQPYIINKAKIDAGKLNIDTIYSSINNYSDVASMQVITSENSEKFNLKDLIIKKLTVVAEEVIINKIAAKNLTANIMLNNGNLKIDRFAFDMAKGKMDGYVSYNINSKKSNFDLNVVDTDANLLAKSMLELDNQIYGDLNGQITLSCTGDNQPECLKSLDGRIAFLVKDGKMPKLGSLEYLLKAGNLIKSGITGLSVNNIINLVTPLKTGAFSQIKGSIEINKGIADKIQIITNGKDLNLFIIGEYDLSDKIADMYVFGRLSRKISNVLGPVGNVSLNTLFSTIPGVNLNNSSDNALINSINKLPGLELTNKMFRVFAAEIHGDISGDNYVESFRWVE